MTKTELNNLIKESVKKHLNESQQTDLVFKKYETTSDLSRENATTEITDLIQRFNHYITKQIPKEHQFMMKEAIKEVWINELKNWKTLR